MEQLFHLVEALQEYPVLAVAGLVALLGGYYLLQRKPRIARDAEQRLAALRKERGGYYTRLRRLR